jgi:riboflavin synthase
MFTGIITEIGRLKEIRPLRDGADLVVEAPGTVPRLALGASVALNGACQTVVEIAPPGFRVQAVGATLQRTTLGGLRPGDFLNLEPSLRAGDELGGHLVLGHVDGVGTLQARVPRGDAVFLTISLPPELVRFAAPRGSLCVDGMSLTVAETEADRVIISLIPHTMQHTIARDYRPGRPVNIEVDIIARYLDRLLGGRAAGSPAAVTLEMLKEKFT